MFRVPRLSDILKGLVQQADSETAAIQTTQDELNDLRPKYQRYRELTEQLRIREERAKIAVGLLSSLPLESEEAGDEGYANALLASFEKLESSGIRNTVNVDEIPLWKVLREVVRQVPEIQVVDAQHALQSLGIKTTRQSIASAIVTHRDVFTVRKRGREKFISLKGV